MKKKKNIIIILSVLFVLVLILYGIVSFILDYNNSKKVIEQNINIINEEYGNFKDDVDEFSLMRDEIYENILNQIYYETFANNVIEWNNKFTEYTKIVNDISKFDKILGKTCLNKTYINTSINQKCEIFVETYEIVINSYINDVELYNQHIEKYNNWKLEKDNANNSKEIEKFDTKIIKYIDYNNDKEYLGKE